LHNKGFLDRTGGNTYGNWVILKDFNWYYDSIGESVPRVAVQSVPITYWNNIVWKGIVVPFYKISGLYLSEVNNYAITLPAWK
jgi:hypothetical protein